LYLSWASKEMATEISIRSLQGLPSIRAGDDLPELIFAAIRRSDSRLDDGDIVVIAQKIVSLAEGRLVRLDDVRPSANAIELADEVEKDPRMVELILAESTDVVKTKPGVVIVRHRLGIVGANAGIDQSNVDHSEGECALLLPEDPDQSARRLRESLMQQTGRNLSVVISDSLNRPWRLGSTGIAIGSAGLSVLDDRRGQSDMYGRELKITLSNRADAIAAAAVLIMGETIERTPVAIVSGFPAEDSAQTARDGVRPAADDMFL
jgi:coenzyme F420-0:L-glutamate ligase/coenzyme F420-1:gamma-L-glutamate ligase